MPDQLLTLTEINLDDLAGAFGWRSRPMLASLSRLVFRAVARKFAQQMLDFDEKIGVCGLVEAARLTERLHVRDVRVYGEHRLPKGNFLALSNHPGMTDTLALFTALGRTDLHTIALDRPFLLSLPNLSRHLFYLPEQEEQRPTLVRQVAKHLRNGGTVMTFPAGRIEPDPDMRFGAIQSLETWIDSAAVFVRLAPGTPVLPVCVRGVTWSRTSNNALVRMRRTADDRQLSGSAIQLLMELMLGVRPVIVRIQIGRPILIEGRESSDARTLHGKVLGEMRRLIENPPEGEGRSVL